MAGAGSTKLVIGASGYLGSHVTRQLVARGDRVRVLVRRTSSTVAFDDLDVEVHYGDLADRAALRSAMAGCDVVFQCAVDTRAFLLRSEPLATTNVEGLRNVLDVALEAGLKKFVATSTIATIGRPAAGQVADETFEFDWPEQGGEYVRTRVEAENLVLDYARARGLPAVAMCVANTYGPGDYAPTGQGQLVIDAASGKRPVYPLNVCAESVGIEDAAAALLLAGDRGRVGERYIVSERNLPWSELYDTAAGAARAAAPRGVPLAVFTGFGLLGDVIRLVTRKDLRMCSLCVRLMGLPGALDHSKAERELGWTPTPVHDSIRAAVEFYAAHGMLTRSPAALGA